MNLQLDHFPMIKPQNNNPTRLPARAFHTRVLCGTTTQHNKQAAARGCLALRRHAFALEHGFHNVSRWMTWLPISLKNAAKCDKWYQLQNHSITESLNANGAREKSLTAIPVHAVSLSVEQKPNPLQKSLGLSKASSGVGGGSVATPDSRHTVGSWVANFVFAAGAAQPLTRRRVPRGPRTATRASARATIRGTKQV